VYPELLVRASNLLEILIAVSPITRSVASRLPTIPGPRRSLGRAVASTHVFPNGRNVGYCHNPAVSDVYRNVWRLDRTNPHFGKLMVWLHCSRRRTSQLSKTDAWPLDEMGALESSEH
jgi:hypothetical protein